MSYCTIDDIRSAMDENDVIRYTDDDGAGIVNGNVIDVIIQKAAALIDAHVAKRYGTVFSPVPALLTGLAVDISVYKLSSRKGQAPDDVRTNFEDAVRMLEKIAAGKADIPGVDIDVETVTDDKTAAVVSRPGHFTQNGLDGF